MNTFINVIAVIVALLHVYFLVLEMFFWRKPWGLKVFRQTLEKAESSAVLAANQGLYNGFLAAGLIWGVFHTDVIFGAQIKTFFFGCVIAAGIYGAFTVSRKIFFIQALPALLGFGLICLS